MAAHRPLAQHAPVASSAPAVWTIDDVCRFLRMGKTWVRGQLAMPLSRGGLPHRYLGRALRFDSEEVHAWWKRQARRA